MRKPPRFKHGTMTGSSVWLALDGGVGHQLSNGPPGHLRTNITGTCLVPACRVWRSRCNEGLYFASGINRLQTEHHSPIIDKSRLLGQEVLSTLLRRRLRLRK